MYNILGIDQNGRKEVLGFYLADSEFWLSVLNDLKVWNRCLCRWTKKLSINNVFPNAEVQLCIMHQIN
ncbi:transposase [Candidatus Mesenet endosymbiont of Phosphuga atrata]|uniref:transposase n=1 Tax=Candidatus Mesenet endosymbiont of Phosphuga atrata TaxID=3066221 RepID=UPI0039779E76